MGASNIITERLIIMPMTYSMVLSILNGDKEAIKRLGVKLNDHWPRQDTLDILWFLKDVINKGEEVSGFDIWMVIKKDGMTVIGDAGFKGDPDETGKIEIGFGLVDGEQNKGYGYEVASSLMAWASRHDNVRTIAADCLLDNIGSIKVLVKCGMKEICRDEEYIYWEKQVNK